MDKVMFQFKHPGGGAAAEAVSTAAAAAPSLHDVAQRFGIDVADLDQEFGVIETDPAAGLYCVLMDSRASAHAAAVLESQQVERDPAEGAFANPPIEPFGPPKSD